jgi:SlyX protein
MPPDTELDEQRFVTLETKLAYQEKMIADLNEVIVDQSRDLDDMRRRVGALERYAKEHLEPRSVPNEKPPHY